MRLIFSSMALLAVTACAPTVPDSGAGVGFGDYKTYQQRQAVREAQLAGESLPAPASVSSETLDANGAVNGGDVATQTSAVLAATRTTGTANNGVINASPSNPAPNLASNNVRISDENDFSAVGARRSIKNDADLIAQNRAQYQVIAPTANPTRTGASGPSVVDFALKTSNPVGTSLYRRSGANRQARYERNCAKYPSPDLAQSDFLAKGGPAKDRLGLDPDGDGYACSWNPAPFRAAKNG